ncbi:gp53-like domain-containing protein [Escherichia coli]|uniref:gp53-like domain-containing protein n=1 Tax=Escherichia coli TaxID=562 RepID=UPI0039A4B912
MHRIDTKTAQNDKFGAGKNGFTRGNPQTGTPATDLDDDYFDMLQEELCSVVEASGASLEKGRHDQLLTALRALLLSRKNPFGDIKSDGTVKTALENLGLGELSDAGVSGGSLTASGYITIPMIINGARRALYIQWGGFTGNTDSSGSNGIYENSNITVTWPVAFPNAVFQVITGGSADVGGFGQQEMTWSLGKTKTYGNFGFQCRTPNASMTGSYLVIGY